MTLQLKELKERQKQQLRHKALKKGLDPEALTGKYPPMIQVASKYERRVDTRSYDDKKKLFEGVSIQRILKCALGHYYCTSTNSGSVYSLFNSKF